MFAGLDPEGSNGQCKPGAKKLPIGSEPAACRWPEDLVAKMRMAASTKNSKLFGKKLQVRIQGSSRQITVNVGDYCADSDCGGCCSKNTGRGKYELLDLEKWSASRLLRFDAATIKDISSVNYPTSEGLRPGAPESDVMPLCYRVIGTSNITQIIDEYIKSGSGSPVV
jgi:hypothetical protein